MGLYGDIQNKRNIKERREVEERDREGEEEKDIEGMREGRLFRGALDQGIQGQGEAIKEGTKGTKGTRGTRTEGQELHNLRGGAP